MKYNNVLSGIFVFRPNRFIAQVLVNGKEETCHVKNTGRCRELLIPGATVFLSVSDNPSRKTKYDLIAVMKGDKIINMDSQAPNSTAAEFIPRLFPDAVFIKPEYKYKNSRIDFYIETAEKKILLEVKGVTLEENALALFPDAPTERGVKHIKELAGSISEGYSPYILFVIQMKGVTSFSPNRKTHAAFADALIEAKKSGVTFLAYDCITTENSMVIDAPVKITL